MNRKCPNRNTIFNFEPPTSTLSPQTSGRTDVGAIWKIYYKHAVNNRTAKISTSGIAIVSMLHGYSRQRYSFPPNILEPKKNLVFNYATTHPLHWRQQTVSLSNSWATCRTCMKLSLGPDSVFRLESQRFSINGSGGADFNDYC